MTKRPRRSRHSTRRSLPGSCFIERLHAKDRTRRPASAAEVADFLERGLAHLEQPDQIPTPNGYLHRTRRSWRWLLAASLLLALCLSIGVLAALWIKGDGRAVPELHDEGFWVVRQPSRILIGHRGPVHRVIVTRDGRFAFSCSGWPEGDRTIRQWDLANGKELRVFTGHKEDITQIVLSPDETRLLSASADGTARIWDVASGIERVRFPEGSGRLASVTAVAWAPSGEVIATGGHDHLVRFWDAAASRQIAALQGHTAPVTCIAFGPQSNLISGSRDGTVRLWDAKSHAELKVFEVNADQHWIHSLALSRDGKHFLVASQIASLWSLETGKQVQTYAGHVHGVNQAVFSPDGRHILSGGYDSRVNLFDVASGRLLARFLDHREFVWTVAFTPDGNSALSGGGGLEKENKYQHGSDHTLRVWDLAPVLETR